jgi:transcriptional regulator with XRE-family HTH domain
MKLRYASLRDFKKANRFTARQLSEELGRLGVSVSTSYLNLLLSGWRSPGKNLARQLSDCTGIPIESLLFPDNQKTA